MEKVLNISNYREYLRLTETSKSMGRSLLLGCSFYRTTKKGVYITDYDLDRDEKLEAGISLLFSHPLEGNIPKMIISNDIFKEKTIFDRAVDEVGKTVEG